MPLRVVTAGESHGPGLTCIVEGLPAGIELDREAINRDMARRQLGHGRTLGSPVALQVANRDFTNWEERMNPWPVEAPVPEVHLPRPGHADLVGLWKYGHDDVRNVLERASARETAARVAGGALARTYLRALGVEVRSRSASAGSWVAVSTERRGWVSVGSGFIAQRTISGSPVVIPPSRPPERLVSR